MPQDTPVGESLLLLEADDADGFKPVDTACSDDDDARNPLPALRTVVGCEDEERTTSLVSVER